MISWVVDRVPARTADGLVSHTIVVYRDAETLGDFRRDKWRLHAITESGLICQQRSLTEWFVPALDVVLVADREPMRTSMDAAAFLGPTPTNSPAIAATSE